MFEFRILGPPNLRRAGKPEAVHLQPKRLALLAFIAALSDDGPCRRDSLVALFWPERTEKDARNALSQALYQLRRALGREALISSGADDLVLSRKAVWCDIRAFRQALREDRLGEALNLYRGPMLQGLHVKDAPDFEHWLEIERERLRRSASDAASSLAEREERGGNSVGAANWLRRRLDLEPDDETALQHLMRSLEDLGDRVGALRAYDSFAARLEEEMGLRPSAKTCVIAERLRFRSASRPEDARSASVAVLPFANLSGDPNKEYFCDGITEEIINVLVRLSGLRVAARTSVLAMKDKFIDVQTLARKLGVRTVLEGTVRQAGTKLRITAQLIDATDGYHIWSQRYDRPTEDIFSIQDEIAKGVAHALRTELIERPNPVRPSPPTQDMEAHAFYLRAMYHRRKRTPSQIEMACGYFQQAVERDPSYAAAHAAAALTYALSGWFLYDVLAPREAYTLAREAAETALRINERLPEAHLAVACTRMGFDWDAEGAEASFKRSLELDPDNLDTIGNYAGFLVLTGRTAEAIALTEPLEILDPFWIMPRSALGIWLFSARRYEEAIERLQQAQEMEPGHFVASLFLGDAYRFKGSADAARVAYERVLERIGRRPIILGRLGELHAEVGNTEVARRILEELRTLGEKRHVLPAVIAGVYLALGDRDHAFSWLQRAYDARDTMLTLLHLWPGYDSIRSDGRFQTLVDKVGIRPHSYEQV